MIHCGLDFFDTGQGHVAAVVKKEMELRIVQSVGEISRVAEELEACQEESFPVDMVDVFRPSVRCSVHITTVNPPRIA